ncbi:MAG: flagellar export protein FliJ [Candidatus Kapaibacteriales bacterium]
MAKKFKYRLESLLNLKAQKVKEIEEAIAKILYFRKESEEEIAEQEEYLRNFIQTKNGVTTALEIQTRQHHREFIEEEISRLRKHLERIIEIEMIFRQRLVEAMKEEKVFEKLKERKFNEYNEEVKREETKILDEISINKVIRKINNRPHE